MKAIGGVEKTKGCVAPTKETTVWLGAVSATIETESHVSQCLIPCHNAEVAQSVEHMTENHGVGSSILPLGTTFCSEGGRSSDRPFLPNARGVPKTQHAQSDVGTGQLIVLPSGSLSRDYPR